MMMMHDDDDDDDDDNDNDDDAPLSYTELDNCRSSDCQALSCLNVCGGPCDATNGTCSSMQDVANNRVLNFYERSKCVGAWVMCDV